MPTLSTLIDEDLIADIEDEELDPEEQTEEEEDVNKYPDIPRLNLDTLSPKLNPLLVADGAGLEKVAQYISRVSEYGWDYETNVTKRFFNRRARTLQIGDRNEQYVIDLLAFAETKDNLIASQGAYRGNWGSYSMPEEQRRVLAPVLSIVGPSLESNSHLKVGHNLEFEYIVSKWCLGLRTWNYYCTMRAERDITNGGIPVHQKDFFGMDDLVRRYCRFQISKASQKTFDLETPLTDTQIAYCALDVRLPLALKTAQEKIIKRDGLQWAVKIDMNAIPAFGDMHLNGMLVDKEQWQKIINDNQTALAKALDELDGHFIPIVGTKQMWDQGEIDRLEAIYRSYDEKSPEEARLSEEILHTPRKEATRREELKELRAAHEAARKDNKEKAKLAYYAERSKGNAKAKSDYGKCQGQANINYGASGQVLKALHDGGFGLNKQNCPNTDGKKTLIKHLHIPIVNALVTYKKIAKQLETYGYRWITSREEIEPKTKKHGFVDPDTGRIHARFQQCAADTGRPSCTDPNLLNLPRDDRFRQSFVSRPGYDLVCKDCSGQELRILAEFSGEPAWVEAFLNEQDLHSISAQMINPELWEKSALPNCAYFNKNKSKCSCPKHKEVRNDYKALTLGIIYGKTAFSLAVEMNKPKEVVEVMLEKWKQTFKLTQQTMDKLRELGYNEREARSLVKRRRIIRQVTFEQAKKSSFEKYGDKSDHSKVAQTYQSLIAAVKREAGNMCIQSSAADQMMTAMGCGFDPNGKPYLWHTLEPIHSSYLQNYVYDEFVVESPEANSARVEQEVEDAIIRSGAEFVKSVPMASEGMISKRWQK